MPLNSIVPAAPPLKSRKEDAVRLSEPKTSLAPPARWMVPPDSVTEAVLLTWSLCERSSVAPLATETELVVAAPPVALGVYRKAVSAPLGKATLMEINKDLTKHAASEVASIVVKALEAD